MICHYAVDWQLLPEAIRPAMTLLEQGNVTKRVFAAASLLLTAACETSKPPHANTPATVQQASAALTGDALAQAEADYISTKRAYVASLAADKSRGVPDSVLDARETAALHDLSTRLRKILGPFHAEGFADSGRTNVSGLVPQMDFGGIDAIVYESSDSVSVAVTTRTLLEAWLRDPVAGDTALPRDLPSALSRTEIYENGVPEDAAVSRYADIPVDHDATQSGVVSAMLVLRAQDFGVYPPNEVAVSVLRGDRVYLVEAPARAVIAPMPSCVPIWDEAHRRVDSLNGADRPRLDSLIKARRSNPIDTTALDSSLRAASRIQDQIENHADSLFRQCYAEQAPADPRFGVFAQQVADIVRRLKAQ